jgi:hypothetical protein
MSRILTYLRYFALVSILSFILLQGIVYARPVPDNVENYSVNEVIAVSGSPSFG